MKQGTLNEVDRDTFTLLCLTWGRIQEAIAEGRGNIEFVCLTKQYTNLAKLFGLDPSSRKKLGVKDGAEDLDAILGL